MKISCVICEYNPFHNGHEYMLSEMRRNGATHIAVIMSGSFTQRGEAAVFDKYTRARAALKGGADLVIELPAEFACAGAERFAFGGVYTANALGCADELVFGSECADIDALRMAAAAVTDNDVQSEFSDLLKSGITFAAARERAVELKYGSGIAGLLRSPNDILGIEYLKALSLCGSKMSVSVIKRKGAEHDGTDAENNIASAKSIREIIYSGKSGYKQYIPDYAYEIYKSSDDQPPESGRMKKLENIILYRLRTMTREEMSRLPEISEGLENRLYSAVHSCTGYEDIINSVKSKRYTHSRISRIITYSLLGLRRDILHEKPEYIRLLGFNSRGREILKAAKGVSLLPIITRISELDKNAEGRKMLETEALCDDIYGLSGKRIIPCGRTMTEKLIID